MKPAIIVFERSGVVRRAFRQKGVECLSSDICPAEDGPRNHIQADAFVSILPDIRAGRFSFVGMHYPCTYLAVSGIHRNRDNPERTRLTDWAVRDVLMLFEAVEFAGVPAYFENPVSVLSTRIRKPDQIIQPHQFGENASKKTCLWLFNLPKLCPTKDFPPRLVEWPAGSGKIFKRWGNQTDSGQNRLPPGENRSTIRSRTYDGIASAMADQWAPFVSL